MRGKVSTRRPPFEGTLSSLIDTAYHAHLGVSNGFRRVPTPCHGFHGAHPLCCYRADSNDKFLAFRNMADFAQSGNFRHSPQLLSSDAPGLFRHTRGSPSAGTRVPSCPIVFARNIRRIEADAGAVCGPIDAGSKGQEQTPIAQGAPIVIQLRCECGKSWQVADEQQQNESGHPCPDCGRVVASPLSASGAVLRASLRDHRQAVRGLAFSPDSRLFAAAAGAPVSTGKSQPGSTILWDIEACLPVATLQWHREAVLSVSFCPQGATMATGSRDGTIAVWDVSRGLWDAVLGIRERSWLAHAGGVASLAFSAGGDRLASTGELLDCPGVVNGSFNYAFGGPDLGDVELASGNDDSMRPRGPLPSGFFALRPILIGDLGKPGRRRVVGRRNLEGVLAASAARQRRLGRLRIGLFSRRGPLGDPRFQ